MKVILSGGGTGGHIYPALTIADQIKKLRPDAQIIFVGTQQGLEKNIIPRYGYPLRYIEIAGFKRSLSFDTLRSFGKLFTGLIGANSLISEIKPDLVIGTGGYVCGPVKKVFLGYREAEKYFTGKSRKIYTGNPIRSEILSNKRSEAVKFFGLDPEKQTILVSGGSRGAQSINKAMLYVEQALSGRHDVQVLHATGEANYEEYIKELNKKGPVEDNIVVKPYLHDMPMALAAADLAVFRAGAIGLAELTAKGVPSVLIPYPYATANHQEFNARAVEAAGAAKVILDKELTGEKLLEEIEHLLIRSEDLQKMKKAAKSLGRPGAAKEIAQQALQLVKN